MFYNGENARIFLSVNAKIHLAQPNIACFVRKVRERNLFQKERFSVALNRQRQGSIPLVHDLIGEFVIGVHARAVDLSDHISLHKPRFLTF